MDQKKLNTLLEKYKEGKCTSEELDEFFLYIKNTSKESIILSFFEEDEFDSERLLSKSRLKETPKEQKIKVLRSYRTLYYLVGSLVMFLFISVYFYKSSTDSYTIPNREIHQLNSAANNLVLNSGELLQLSNKLKYPQTIFENERIEIVQSNLLELKLIQKSKSATLSKDETFFVNTGRGNRLKVSFPDGSYVWLNAESQLKFPGVFSKNERRVELLGEGYFDINNAKDLPFFVQTPQQLIQVYGTRFNIRNYSNEDKHTVLLYEGKLSVREKVQDAYENEVLLIPGEQVDLYKSAKIFHKKPVEVNQDSSVWITGARIYENTLLREIFLDLSHQYDMKIDWSKIPKLHFTGRLSQSMTLDDIIDILNKTANANIKNNSNIITF